MSKRTLVLMCSIFLIVPLLFYGCGDGSTGPAGAQGPQGPPGNDGSDGSTGPAGPTSTTNASCMVCHTTGRIADVSDASATGFHYNYQTALPQLAVTIDNIVYGVSPDNASLTRLTTTFTPTAGATLNLYYDGLTVASGSNLKYLRFAYARLASPVPSDCRSPISRAISSAF